MFLAKEELHRYLGLIQRCATLIDVHRVHVQIAATRHYLKNTLLANTLVQMYGIMGSLADARNAFDAIAAARNLFSWNILIAAHVRHSQPGEAERIFAKMPARDVVSYNTVIAALARADRVVAASDLFCECPERDPVSWNAIITALAQSGHLDLAMALLNRSPQFGLVSSTSIMAACVAQGRIDRAQEIFNGLQQQDVVAQTILFAAYAQIGDISRARWMFDRIASKDSTSWTTIIAAYIGGSDDDLREARNLFDRVQDPEAATYNVIISAYAQKGQMQEARRLLARMPHPDPISWTTIISGYNKLGEIDCAREIFDQMPDRDTVAWNAMISGYCQSARPSEALDLFKLMIVEGINPVRETFVAAIDACAAVPAEREGKLVHVELLASGVRPDDAQAHNALLSMYGRMGHLEVARDLFDAMESSRDRVTWTAMLAAYAQSGHLRDALGIFHAMVLHGEAPDGVTFINVLAACAHAGLVRTGWAYFVSMWSMYGVEPGARHFVCMVDMLARSGEVCTAAELAGSMPYQPSSMAWMSMAGACREQGDAILGENALEYALDGPFDARSVAGVALWSQMR
ncbi:pentatricopeptide repeat-containing protein At4g02750 [Selaginella moellendorffii]|nr:pentatricopeptide repeat-containing protein At4g02750 [Selaginella moellendorffii]|eukprot:XP_002990952.2 pentatricopeptide repeat-containing protein At4g02750 [Selaginella moellendorffii]